MNEVRLNDTLAIVLSTLGTTGAAADTDAIPTVVIRRNGTTVSPTVSITNPAVGIRNINISIASAQSWASGDYGQGFVEYAIGGVTQRQGFSFVVRTAAATASDVTTATSGLATQASVNAIPTTTAPTVAAIRTELDSNSTKLANLNATVSSRSSHSAADVWGAATRTLTGFGFTVSTSANATETAIKALTDKLNTALEQDGSVYRFTVNALEQAPSGGGNSADYLANTPDDYEAGEIGRLIGRLRDAEGVDTPVIVVEASTNLNICVVYGYLKTHDDVPLANIEVTFLLQDTSSVEFGSTFVAPFSIKKTTNSEGYFQANLLREHLYKVICIPANLNQLPITVPDLESAALATLTP